MDLNKFFNIFKNQESGSIEEELVEEKAKNQRASNKKNLECRKLRDEVEELRASERNLKVRVKSLVNELSMYKGRRSNNGSISSRTQRSFEKPRSRNNSGSCPDSNTCGNWFRL